MPIICSCRYSLSPAAGDAVTALYFEISMTPLYGAGEIRDILHVYIRR